MTKAGYRSRHFGRRAPVRGDHALRRGLSTWRVATRDALAGTTAATPATMEPHVTEAFIIVMFVVVILSAIIAVIAFAGAGKVYGEIGKGHFALDREQVR